MISDQREGRLWGHEDAFPPPRLSARSAIRMQAFAGTCGNEEDAPKPDIGLETDHTAAKPVSGSRRRVLPAAGARVLLWWIGPARSRLQ